jgi:hypothetical protein
MGPLMGNYHLWMSKIKQAFDPNGSSDYSHYIPPYDELVKSMNDYVLPVNADVLDDVEDYKD